jgi:hypothetical protein
LLIWLGVQLGSKIEERMECVWRKYPPAKMSMINIALRIIGALLATYVIFHSLLPQSWPAQGFLNDHINGWVIAIIVSVLIALFTPPWLVLHLRSWFLYRLSVQGLKLYLLPLFFAVSFVILGLFLGNHLLFSIEDSFGAVCKESGSREGLSACLPATIATCGAAGSMPTCSNGRAVSCGDGSPVCEVRTNPACDPRHANCDYNVPVCHISTAPAPGASPTKAAGFAVCPSSCEVRPSRDDAVTKHIDNVLDISAVCKATGIWLEQGQKYRINVRAPGPGSASSWTDDGRPVSTRGTNSPGMTLAQRFQQIVYWPLKRHLFVEPFKVIARVGSTGSDETVLEPDDDKRSNDLDVVITPRRSGELFLYVNDSIWALKPSWNNFYQDNVGKATIELRRAN